MSNETKASMPPGTGLSNAGGFLTVIAVLSGIGAAALGIYLLTRTGQDCTTNPYGSSYGLDLQDCSTTHPFKVAGVATLVGGAIQAATLGIVARLAFVVHSLRERVYLNVD